ncbi:NAD(P)-dependent oxidoreductase [Actinokineospora sp. HUAS TT18]|uniref:NAD(P)-dependent oxidoreductase n=1 Tax=Actinokineospora sp. HUAS TT18 TaxID=3447451 RepID=UPI003F521DDB
MAHLRNLRWSHGSAGHSVEPDLGGHLPTVALLGLGHMGTAIALRLLRTPIDLVAWNRTASRADTAAAAGARIRGTPAEAVADADFVITMLSDPAAVHAVLFGPDGAAAAMRPDARLIEMSTIGPAAVHAIRERIHVVDAPVGGSTSRVEAGTAVLFTGGTPADVDAAEPVLSAIGTVLRCGGPGSGAAAKLVANAALLTAATALGECLALADALGVAPDITDQVLGRGPLGVALKRSQDPSGFFATTLAAKDLQLIPEPTPLIRLAKDLLTVLADEHEDIAAIPGHIRRTRGTP